MCVIAWLSSHRFFHEQGYFWIHTPIITASDCEGAGEMFRVSTLDLLNLPKTAQGGWIFPRISLVEKPSSQSLGS
ncbi:amino acid--tRNA ligase-related protein [Legionella taurinensis]|uniref:amino acid--tRNA ligase-related protein n=1 Tax=Legionella taurinensis TaxID=70611 RepID=UPI002114A830|nr:amino acid--tRNA ligase-related protein [Legionella taurinensis]